ncbi:helix-turn-helix transcriptional regulator [Paenibacillus xylanexedens]|uniref:helix-turn-helix domain-containing protein n=1 Tax=Paenibacillus xylanexedens TaxID=528191 RepID=UPI0011A4E32B|nr:helix-turn-helix transcriptional regulator [Paenibacillus xylanexedens]
MAIGLSYICKINDTEYTELASELGTSPQNINSWLSEKRKIPSHWLEKLESRFNVEACYFQKTLTLEEELILLGDKVIIKRHNGLSDRLTGEEIEKVKQYIDFLIYSRIAN